jgi:radical SAM protein with 4Fe4S-binding SPASM domain
MIPEFADPPRYMQIEPVGQCNLRCRMCPIQFRQDGLPPGPPAFIDFDLYRRLIDESPQLEELHLQGMGEPLMHPRFFEMVQYAVQRGIRVSTNSNLTLMTERRARACVASGLHTLYVSLDGATAATYEYIRVRARFNRVLRNLRRLLEIKSQTGSTCPEVALVAVGMRRNLRELPELIRLAHRLGIGWLEVQHLCHDFSEDSLPAQYRPMHDFVQHETLLQESEARVAEVFEEVRTLAEQFGMRLRLPSLQRRAHPPSMGGRARCNWPWHGPYISFAGDAMPCCMVSTPDRATLGNVARDGLARVWNNEAYADFRRRLASEEPPTICRGCSVYAGTF